MKNGSSIDSTFRCGLAEIAAGEQPAVEFAQCEKPVDGAFHETDWYWRRPIRERPHQTSEQEGEEADGD